MFSSETQIAEKYVPNILAVTLPVNLGIASPLRSCPRHTTYTFSFFLT